jgi:aldehyde oxidoreductase
MNHSDDKSSPSTDSTAIWQLNVNGVQYTTPAHPTDTLLDVLRRKLDLTGAKAGCDSGTCGVCTVVIGNRAVKACRIMMRDLPAEDITTIEGLQNPDGTLHPIQKAFLLTGAVQCGFCTPGMIMSVYALLQNNTHPDKQDIRNALQGNLCRCTGYQPIENAVFLASKLLLSDRSVILPPQIDGVAKVTGRARFTNDLTPDQTLYGAIVWSPAAAGVLRGINSDKARGIPGVIRIITAADIPGKNALGRLRADRPLLAEDHIRFSGDPIALVLADNPNTARQAAKHVVPQIQRTQGLFHSNDAQDDNAPRLYSNGNIASEIHIVKTDAEFDPIVEYNEYDSEFKTQFVEHAVLEPESAVAYFEDATLVVIAPSQNVFFDRMEVMRLLGLSSRDLTRVRIKESYTGAAFGKREDIIAAPLAALGAWLTGNPVKICFNRHESFLATTKRHPMTIAHKTTIGSDNRIYRQSVNILADTGAYSSWAPNILRKAAVHASGPYFVPRANVTGRSVHTNNAFSGAMRGFGAVQAHLAAERHMDMIARKRNIDPVVFRQINAIRTGLTTVTGQTIHYMTDVSELIKTAAEKLPWNGPARGRQVSSDWAVGFGIAASFYGIGYGNGIPDKGQAELVYFPNRSLHIYTSAIDYGQGAKTVFAQLASEILELSPNQITVVTGDTAITPDSGSTVASRQTFVTGNAVVSAARKLVNILQQTPEPQKALRVKSRYMMDSRAIHPNNGQGNVYKTFSASAATARVKVNRRTGEIITEKIVSVHDSGTIINPVLSESQVTGGVMMGIGMALYEDYRVTQGIPESTDFSNYIIPRFNHTPNIQVVFLPTADPSGPNGAKGLGEPATLAAAPAVVNAVCDAINTDLTSTPVRPETIIKILNTQ